jgi:16S rRNA (uracil1498-N3)-methyltransferase
MAVHDFSAQRLFVGDALAAGRRVSCSPEQANYLLRVLRLGPGDAILAFNGRDGEWRCVLEAAGKRDCALVAETQVRPQEGGPDLEYLFAPLKRARLDYMVQKAVELGVAALRPVLTRHTVAERVNLERMRANAIEAAEQCGILRLPDIAPPERLEQVLDRWDGQRTLVFCDEDAEPGGPLAALSGVTSTSLAVLIGPEGGFDARERERILRVPGVVRLSLGPRIMRADTAAVAALALVNAAVGDWR